MMEYNQNIVDTICDTLVKAGSSFLLDKKKAYTLAINKESNAHAKWVLQTVLQNAEVAERTRCPLCDDTGIPHILIEIGSYRKYNRIHKGRCSSRAKKTPWQTNGCQR